MFLFIVTVTLELDLLVRCLGIYQRLSPRLHFNAANFQAYVKAKEGTNFILLHFVCALVSC